MSVEGIVSEVENGRVSLDDLYGILENDDSQYQIISAIEVLFNNALMRGSDMSALSALINRIEDLGIYIEYAEAIVPWDASGDDAVISEHIEDYYVRSDNENVDDDTLTLLYVASQRGSFERVLGLIDDLGIGTSVEMAFVIHICNHHDIDSVLTKRLFVACDVDKLQRILSSDRLKYRHAIKSLKELVRMYSK